MIAKGLEFSSTPLREPWDAGSEDMRSAIEARAMGRPDLRDLGFALCRPRVADGAASATAADNRKGSLPRSRPDSQP